MNENFDQVTRYSISQGGKRALIVESAGDAWFKEAVA
jgi:hypothetical protein